MAGGASVHVDWHDVVRDWVLQMKVAPNVPS
jgi:hypothetical protein